MGRLLERGESIETDIILDIVSMGPVNEHAGDALDNLDNQARYALDNQARQIEYEMGKKQRKNKKRNSKRNSRK